MECSVQMAHETRQLIFSLVHNNKRLHDKKKEKCSDLKGKHWVPKEWRLNNNSHNGSVIQHGGTNTGGTAPSV